VLFSTSLDKKFKAWKLVEGQSEMTLYEDLYKYICSKMVPTSLFFLKYVATGGHELLYVGGNEARLLQWDMTAEFLYHEYVLKIPEQYNHQPTKVYELVKFSVSVKDVQHEFLAINSWDLQSSCIVVVNPAAHWQQPEPLLLAYDDHKNRKFTEMAFVNGSLVIGTFSGDVGLYELSAAEHRVVATKYGHIQLSNLVRQVSTAHVKFSTDVECHLLFLLEQFGERDSRSKGKGSLSVWNIK
jgi:hypothetical protein